MVRLLGSSAVTHISGTDRFDTAAKAVPSNATTFIVANGYSKVDALAVRMDEKFDRIIELREIDRKESGHRAWKIALALPVEVVVLFAGVAAVLEWLRG